MGNRSNLTRRRGIFLNKIDVKEICFQHFGTASYAIFISKNFFETLPYPEMVNLDEKLKSGSGYFFGKEGEIYLLYLVEGGPAVIDLKGHKGDYEILWFDPRKGGDLQPGSIQKIKGDQESEIGKPPSNENLDWAILIRNISKP